MIFFRQCQNNHLDITGKKPLIFMVINKNFKSEFNSGKY